MTTISSERGIFNSGFLSDRSARFLILSNIVLIIFALVENWNLITIMYIYWCQSIIIGFFTFLKMLTLKNYSTEGVNYNTMPVTIAAKVFMSFFFLFHYGMFHFGYYMFLISGAFFSSSLDLTSLGIALYIVVGVFFVNHLYSFLHNRERDANKKQNIGKIMFFPYIRIIPMHLTIVFGGIFMMGGGNPKDVILLFLLLKTFADVAMHSVEHRESIASQMKIELEKTNYSPGENIRGNLILDLEKPIKAKSLTIAFIVEKKIISGSGDNRSTQRYEIHKSKKRFDEEEYFKNTYFFDFQVPSDIISMVKKFESPYHIRAKKYAQKYPRLAANLFKEYDLFCIQAKFDIPYGLDIKNREEIIVK